MTTTELTDNDLSSDETTDCQREEIQKYFRLRGIAAKSQARYITKTFIICKEEFDALEFTKIWDYFRINNPLCLAKFSSIEKISAYYKDADSLVVDLKIYQGLCIFFETLIMAPHNHKMMNVISNNPNQNNVYISCKEDDEDPCWVFHSDNKEADHMNLLKSNMMLDPSKTLLYIFTLNLDEPFDLDPDREANYDDEN